MYMDIFWNYAITGQVQSYASYKFLWGSWFRMVILLPDGSHIRAATYWDSSNCVNPNKVAVVVVVVVVVESPVHQFSSEISEQCTYIHACTRQFLCSCNCKGEVNFFWFVEMHIHVNYSCNVLQWTGKASQVHDIWTIYVPVTIITH